MYYQFTNGKRYDAALIRNAEFRVRGERDGRISKADAQVLWQIAMDGGRITEIEEETLRYLVDNFNWTEAAEDWLEEAFSEEIQKVSSYYKVIDGLRYDRKILEKADELTKGRGDGRISKEDATVLLPLFGDFGDIRIEEERAYHYLLEQYTWTDAAKEWFSQQFDPISKESDVYGQINAIVLYEFNLRDMKLGIIASELKDQTLKLANKVSFPEALRKAIDNLFNYDGEFSLRRSLDHFGPNVSDPAAALLEYQRMFLNGGRLNLLPGEYDEEPTIDQFPTPLREESIEENWIFGLELYDLTDNIYWIVVPRDGAAPYNYIGGANYEENWPRE